MENVLGGVSLLLLCCCPGGDLCDLKLAEEALELVTRAPGVEFRVGGPEDAEWDRNILYTWWCWTLGGEVAPLPGASGLLGTSSSSCGDSVPGLEAPSESLRVK